MRQKFATDWADLNAEWQAYIATLDYGFDFDRMAIDFKSGKPLSDTDAYRYESPPTAAGSRPAFGSRPASRTT